MVIELYSTNRTIRILRRRPLCRCPWIFLKYRNRCCRGFFLELAEEARYVDVGSGQSCYTEEVQSQEAGLTRPVLVTIIECSSSVPKGGLRQLPVSLPRVYHLFLLLVGPWDKTEQSVLPGSDKKMMEPIPQAQ